MRKESIVVLISFTFNRKIMDSFVYVVASKIADMITDCEEEQLESFQESLSDETEALNMDFCSFHLEAK